MRKEGAAILAQALICIAILQKPPLLRLECAGGDRSLSRGTGGHFTKGENPIPEEE